MEYKSGSPVGQHREAASDRLSPNLRSAYCPLLGGRAMVHLIFDSIFDRGSKLIQGTSEIVTQGDVLGAVRSDTIGAIDIGLGAHKTLYVHPLCCSTFRRGTVISAVLSWSPMSSDCAFIPEGCSVSSRYTFPLKGGLGSA